MEDRAAAGPAPSESGVFFCPRCMTRRPYRRIRVRRTLRIGSLPLVAWGALAEHVECESCLATYRPEVLAYDAGDATAHVMAEYQRAMKRVLALMVASDGRIREEEIPAVQEVFEAITGIRLRREQVLEEVAAVRREPTTAARFLARVAGYLNEYGKEQILRAAVLISRADADVDRREAGMIHRLARAMRMDPERAARVEAELTGE